MSIQSPRDQTRLRNEKRYQGGYSSKSGSGGFKKKRRRRHISFGRVGERGSSRIFATGSAGYLWIPGSRACFWRRGRSVGLSIGRLCLGDLYEAHALRMSLGTVWRMYDEAKVHSSKLNFVYL